MMKRALLTLTALLLSACVMNTIEAETVPIKDRAVIEKAKGLVADRMRDPEATRFKDDVSAYMTKQGDYIVCGTLNAKNAMGGYVGYKPFYVRIRGGAVAAFTVPSEMDEYNIQLNAVIKSCADAAKGKVMVSS